MVFNYKDMVFERQHGENFDVLYMCFLDYHQEIKEVTITWSAVGRRSIWLARFSGLTTEYTGTLAEVLEKVNAHYLSNEYKEER